MARDEPSSSRQRSLDAMERKVDGSCSMTGFEAAHWSQFGGARVKVKGEPCVSFFQMGNRMRGCGVGRIGYLKKNLKAWGGGEVDCRYAYHRRCKLCVVVWLFVL